MSLRRVLVLSAVMLLAGQTAQAEWQLAKGPLLTKWSKDVSPTNALPEYPRPQMVRPEWTNLNGVWQWDEAKQGQDAPFGKDLSGEILVPYPIESALSGVMKHVERLWYRRTFDVKDLKAGDHALLHFGAVDWEAVVYVNGKKIGEHRGGYDAFSCDITNVLKKDGPQELVVGVFDPTDQGQQPRGKQVLNPGGIMYTPVTGIWQTVWLEKVPASHVARLVLTPDVEGKCLKITALVSGDGEGLSVKATAADGGREVGKAEGKPDAELKIAIDNAKLWSPDEPFLYDLKVELLKDGKPIDAVSSYFGMRSVKLAKDEKGIQRPMLNGKFVFQVGPLDQGFWPDGIYTAPTDEALKFDIEITKKLGFNMARKHVKVEPARWYYWADKLGLLVWQDMPGSGNQSPESQKQFEVELARMLEGFHNQPSIIMWVVFNEGWGQYDTERLTAWVQQKDPSRLVNNASGWTDKKCGNVIDMHSYPDPNTPKPEENRAAVLGEFGGLGLAVEGHTWKKESWGYQGMANAEALTRRYEGMLQRVYKLRDDPGMSACVYTQTTDVEVECNGLLTYDRAIVKPDLERIAAVNRGDFSKVPPAPIEKPIVATSKETAQKWRYTFDKPAEGWFKPDFDASAWKEGEGGFGTKGTPGAVVRTEWKSDDIYLRREIELPEGKLTNPALSVHHDEDCEIYVNGVLACKLSAFTSEYEMQPLTAEGLAALKPGKNVLAVHCHQTQGGQYIDVGLIDILPPKAK